MNDAPTQEVKKSTALPPTRLKEHLATVEAMERNLRSMIIQAAGVLGDTFEWADLHFEVAESRKYWPPELFAKGACTEATRLHGQLFEAYTLARSLKANLAGLARRIQEEQRSIV